LRSKSNTLLLKVLDMYTAVVLDELSQSNLISHFVSQVPDGWEMICHHMTINLGKAVDGPAADLLGNYAKLIVTKVGQSDKVIAVEVETDVPSKKSPKHITVALNRVAGGKPKDSNNLQSWTPIPSIQLSGVVQEVALKELS